LIAEDSNGVVSLFPLVPFFDGKCGDSQRVKSINKFKSAWETESFYPEKFLNLNRCPLKVAFSRNLTANKNLVELHLSRRKHVTSHRPDSS
jgi:hypothetical protein